MVIGERASKEEVFGRPLPEKPIKVEQRAKEEVELTEKKEM